MASSNCSAEAEWGPLLVASESGQAPSFSLTLYRSPGEARDGLIVPRLDAPVELDSRLEKIGAADRPVVFGLFSEPYPTDELGHQLMRRCLEVCLRRGAPVAIITRSPLIERDVDLIARIAQGPGASVAVGATLFDAARARAFEPQVASPGRRLETLRTLSRGAIRTTLSIAPAIWGLSDTDLVRLVNAGAEAGARAVYYRRLNLQGAQAERLVSYVKSVVPDRARRVAAGLKWSIGHDAAEDAMRQIVSYTADRLGLALHTDAPWTTGDPRKPSRPGEQLCLFESDAPANMPPPLPLV